MTTDDGECFHVTRAGSGTPTRCTAPVAFRGWHIARGGKQTIAESCPDHVHGLVDWHQLG